MLFLLNLDLRHVFIFLLSLTLDTKPRHTGSLNRCWDQVANGIPTWAKGTVQLRCPEKQGREEAHCAQPPQHHSPRRWPD